ncbi:Leucine rich repeat 5 [Penicillium soppii]|uniref:Leucine rich repeat 5 n=1 Tax=Penicillium soppii TaxID=69789 RepID=UPI0025475A7E|nr:Leucine rich repeat 5 [Penicillium soppii]KAJ5881772.1 Leucine rich repeat 5 [Penicillium soppii]
MMSLKYILPALAASQMVFASSDDCGDTKIKTQSDADGINTCSTISGDITIDESYSGDLILSGIEKITGGLSCSEGANVSSITASELTSIGKTFDLEGLTTLTLLDFAQLDSVGSINWDALPKLQSLNFAKGVTEAGDVSITNTGLTDLNGISLQTVGLFSIQNNRDLKTININNLKNATKSISFSGNYDTLEVNFPNLGTGVGMTFQNISAVSLPSLEKLTGQLGFWGTKFETFSAPNLTQTGDLIFKDNTKLSNISMPVLKTVNGGFTIARDDELNIISLSNLETVKGAIDFSGTFNKVSLGALKDVEGAFNMQSTHGNFSCSDFKKLKTEDVIKGKFSCNATNDNPTTANGTSGTGSGTSTGSGSSSTSSGAAFFTGANVPVVGIAAFFGALASFL